MKCVINLQTKCIYHKDCLFLSYHISGTLSKIIVDNRRNSYFLEGLDVGVTYRVCIQSVGMTNIKSDRSCVIDQPAIHRKHLHLITDLVLGCE